MRALDESAVEEGTPGRDWGLRWWRELLYVVLVYAAYSGVRNQFGSGGGEVDPEPAFNHGKAIIQLQKNIGLCYLPSPRAAAGTAVEIDIRGRNVSARVVPTPFVRR